MALNSIHSLCVAISLMVLANTVPNMASAQNQDIPGWLRKHVGTAEGKIAPIVLERARALHLRKLRSGEVRNPCYLAMDATRPSTDPSGAPGHRFYVICEHNKSFRAVSSGYGNGRKLKNADFSNGRQCARNFSNAEGSKLTAGGSYVTAETRTSFKGYFSESGKRRPFYRTFLLFDGEGEARNARERAIGGHQAVFLRWQCRFEHPESAHADDDGFVPFGRLVNYTSGRSNGCTTWSPEVSEQIIALVQDNPTTLYIYPEGDDVRAVAKGVKRGETPEQNGTYWNATCLKEIGTPRFWPKSELQPVIRKWRRSLPKQPPLELPICD
ncbi:MAG: hypothetical protein ACWA47_11090 [Brevirhabdus sp.]